MSLAGAAGIDVWRCEFCDLRVRKDRPSVMGLDGMHAHRACVDAYRRRERAADAREYSAYRARRALDTEAARPALDGLEGEK